MTLEDVIAELDALARHGLEPVLFGGWAKELLGAWSGGAHEDLDALVVADGIERLEAFVAARGAASLERKRHPHKRAYVIGGALVELFLVRRDADGLHTTDFFARHRHPWLAPLARDVVVAGRAVAVATPENIVAYEREHAAVQDAMYAAHPGLREEIVRLYGDAHIPCRHPFAA